VDWAVADSILGPWRFDGSPAGARLLRTIPGELIGPGHNSIAQGPDGEDYIVFHAWDASMSARRMFMDRLRWTEKGPSLAEPAGATPHATMSLE
jgi:hypothetical protein